MRRHGVQPRPEFPERQHGTHRFGIVENVQIVGIEIHYPAAVRVGHAQAAVLLRPARVEQIAGQKAFRIGQRRDVLVRKLVCAGTLEDRIDQLIASKRDLAERVVGAGEGWLTELSTDDLADVLRLSAKASVGA